MSKNATPPKDSDDVPEAKPKSGGQAMVIPMLLLLVLNLGGTGFVAAKVMKPVKVQVEATPPPGDEHGAAASVVGTLDPFVVNLNEPGSTRFLKANFEIELSSAHALEEMNANKRMVRDELLRYLSGLAVSDTLGEAAKAKIRDEVNARVDKALGGGRVRHTYFTEFVVQ